MLPRSRAHRRLSWVRPFALTVPLLATEDRNLGATVGRLLFQPDEEITLLARLFPAENATTLTVISTPVGGRAKPPRL